MKLLYPFLPLPPINTDLSPALDLMSASFLSPSIPRAKTSLRTMAACVDNARAKPTLTRPPPCKLRHPHLYTNYVDLLRPAADSPAAAPDDDVWAAVRREAQADVDNEPILRNFYVDAILSHGSLESSLACYLASKLCFADVMPRDALAELFAGVLAEDPAIGRAARADLRAARDRDPACASMAHCLLHYKGFLALQAHRVAHRLWVRGRAALALFVQGRSSEVFAVDIHPGARVGSGVLLDHATGVVIGETAVVGDDVSILHGVTLGGTGKECGDRHPKIGDGVLVGAGTHILGNVRVGAGAKVGAGSVVLKPVPPRTTAVGNPARLIGGKENPVRLEEKPALTMDHTSWSDYVI